MILTVVTTESRYSDRNHERLENLSDVSLEDDVPDNSNIFSDPESEWGMEKKPEQVQATKSPDSRPEVDQPSIKLRDE